MKSHKKCLLCSGYNIRPLIGYYDRHGLIKCQDCRFVFMEKSPTIEELKSHYNSYSYESEGYLSPITIKSYNSLLDEFEKLRKNNKILDVGCGRGWFLEEAKKRGWKSYGTEFSETAIKICGKKGIVIIDGELDSSKFDFHDFDVITSFEVLEHINKPHQELRSVSKLLRKGGLFYCTTPNFNSLIRYYLKGDYNVIGYPEHLSYYTKSTLNKLLRYNSFELIKFLSTGISITRFRTSTKMSDEKFISKRSSDEILRKSIEKRWYLGILKRVVNSILTLTNTGMTLKGYYVKN